MGKQFKERKIILNCRYCVPTWINNKPFAVSQTALSCLFILAAVALSSFPFTAVVSRWNPSIFLGGKNILLYKVVISTCCNREGKPIIVNTVTAILAIKVKISWNMVLSKLLKFFRLFPTGNPMDIYLSCHLRDMHPAATMGSLTP